MRTFNSKEPTAELLQPSWLWKVVSICAAFGTLCKEAAKTALWFPCAVYELWRGHLGPDVRNGLLVSVAGICILTGMWYYLSTVLTFDPKTAPYQDIFFWSGFGMYYLALGFTVRNGTKHYDILK